MNILNKKSYFSFFLFFFLFEANVYSMIEDEESGRLALVHIISNVGEGSMNLYEKDKEDSLKQEMLSDFKNHNNLNKFEEIPFEIYESIFNTFSPLDAIYLSMTSKELNKRSIECWGKYLKNNGLEKWSPEISSIKTAHAHQLLTQGQIEKAAKLGHPKAVFILHNRAEKRKNRTHTDNTPVGREHRKFIATRKFSLMSYQ